MAAKILSILLYPASLSLLCLASAILFRKRARLFYSFALASFLILWLSSSGWFAARLVGSLERMHLPAGELPTGDLILVLGGAMSPPLPPRTRPEVSEAADRVLYAAELHRKGKAPRVLCAGGAGLMRAGWPPEAELMGVLLQELGVPASAILYETKSRTTREHTLELAALLEATEIRRVLLVTSAMHMPRAMAAFQKQHPDKVFVAAPADFRLVDVRGSGSAGWLLQWLPRAECLRLSTDALHERMGLLYYRLRGWI